MSTARTRYSHPAFELFGSEARARVAFAFIPDPSSEVSIPQMAGVIGKPQESLGDAVSSLCYQGLLEKGDPNQPGPRTFTRVENPLWAIYETAKIAFRDLGIEIRSVAETVESEQ